MLSNSFRLANIDDTLSLLEWRNDKLSRKFSFNNNPINIDNHKTWLNDKIKSPKSNIYIYQNNKVPQGMIRLDEIKNNQYIISWIISPKYRNKGIAKQMLDLFYDNFKGEFIAKIKSNNLASCNIAKHTKMKLKHTKNNFYVYKINIL